MRTVSRRNKDNQAREVSTFIAMQLASDIPIIISGERERRFEVARRGKGVKWPTFQAGGEKEKRELPRDSQQPPIVAGRMTQKGWE